MLLRLARLLGVLSLARALSPFRAWCASAGVLAPSVEHAECGGVPGVRVAAAGPGLAAGERAIVVPDRVALRAPAEPRGAPSDVRLALALLRERRRGSASPWRGYLERLPSVDGTDRARCDMLARWSEEELAWLHAPALAERARRRAADDRAAHARLEADAVPGADGVSLAEFEWALDVVRTRAIAGDFGFDGLRPVLATQVVAAAVALGTARAGDDGGATLVLGAPALLASALALASAAWLAATEGVRRLGAGAKDYVLLPFVDDVNHSGRGDRATPRVGQAVQFEPLRAQFSWRAARSYAPGEELAMAYRSGAAAGNAQLLLNWGFVEADNAHDSHEVEGAGFVVRRGGRFDDADDLDGADGWRRRTRSCADAAAAMEAPLARPAAASASDRAAHRWRTAALFREARARLLREAEREAERQLAARAGRASSTDARGA